MVMSKLYFVKKTLRLLCVTSVVIWQENLNNVVYTNSTTSSLKFLHHNFLSQFFLAPPLIRLTHQHDNLVKNTTSCILVSFNLNPKFQSSNKALLSKITYQVLYFATHERISKAATDNIRRFLKQLNQVQTPQE